MHKIVVETFVNPGEPSTARIRVRPIAGQVYPPGTRVQFSRNARSGVPVGTRLLLVVDEVVTASGAVFLRHRQSIPWERVDGPTAIDSEPQSPNMQQPPFVGEPEHSALMDRAERFAQVQVRPDQVQFRRRVFVACNGRCVISGCDVPEALDAAHKLGSDWRQSANSSTDGWLLRKDLHGLYDKRLLTISTTGLISVDKSARQAYAQFHGSTISSV